METLQELRTIILGKRTTVYADHKKLTYKHSSTGIVPHWILMLEEYGPTNGLITA